MKIFICIGLILSVAFLIFAAMYSKDPTKFENKNRKKNKQQIEAVPANESPSQPLKTNKLRKLFEMDEFKNNYLKLSNGRYRAGLSISSQDIELLNSDEQENFTNSLLSFGLSLASDIQFYTTTEKVETEEPTKQIQKVIDSSDEKVSDKLKAYSDKLKNSLNILENEHGTYVRKSYAIVGVNNMYEEKRAVNELKFRVDNVIEGLARANMKIDILQPEKLAQVIMNMTDKGNNYKIDEMIDKGAMDLYSEGLGVIISNEKETKEAETA